MMRRPNITGLPTQDARRWLQRAGCALALAAAACAGHPLDGISIVAVELREAPKLEFLRARVGMKFLEVRFEFENQTEETVVLRALDFSLRDTQGELFPFSAQVLDMGQPRGTVKVEVAPAQRQSGSVIFQIPATSVPGELIYRQEAAGGVIVRLASGG